MMFSLRHYPGHLLFTLEVLAVLAVVFVGYWTLRKRLPAAISWPLKLLRLFAMLLLAGILLGPVLLDSGGIPLARKVSVYVDRSRSMLVADGPDGQTRFDTAKEIVTRQAGSGLKGGESRIFMFAEQVEKVDGLDKIAPAGRGTDIAGVLRRINEDPGKPDLALLITDGAATRGEDPIEFLRGSGSRVPINVIGIGKSEGPPDIFFLDVSAPSAAAAGDQVPVSAVIGQRGFGGHEATVVVERNGEPLMARKVQIKDESRQTIALEITADTPGWMNYSLSIAVPSGPAEFSHDNNAAGFSVRVADREPLRVLYIESSLRWTTRFLRASLDSDTDVVADLRFDIVPNAMKKEIIPVFPATREELFRYDVVILGDLPQGYLRTEDLDALYDFVAVRGGGLGIEGGLRPLDHYAGTAIEKLLPVFLGVDAVSTAAAPYAVDGVITDAGRHHPAMAALLGFTNLPLMKITRNYRAKPSGGVLLSARGTDAPLILAQRFGRGYVLFSASGFLWKWGFPGIPAASGKMPVYKDFWGRAARWLGRNRYSVTHYELTTDKSVYKPGEAVKARCEVQDAACRPDSRATVVLKTSAGAAYRMTPTPDQPGAYVLDFPMADGGPLYLTAYIESGGRLAGEARCAIQCYAGDEEALNPALHESVLKQIALLSGGRYYSAGEADQLRQTLAAGAVRLTPKEEHKLWDKWPVLAALLGFLVLELFLRRRSGLA